MQKLFLPILALSIMLGMVSCNDNKDCCGIPPPTTVLIVAYVDSANNDLLNPNNEGSYAENEIMLFYEVDGEKQEPQTGADSTSNWGYIPITGQDFSRALTIQLNDASDKAERITYIQLSESDTDTVVHTVVDGNDYHLKRLWYNGEELLAVNGFHAITKRQ